jgi:hypothetical protein
VSRWIEDAESNVKIEVSSREFSRNYDIYNN